MLLARDPDAEVAATAEQTIQSIPAASLSALLARPDLSTDVREFLTARGVMPATGVSVDGPLVDTAAVDADDEADAAVPAEGEERPSVLQKIQSLNVAGRMVLAMKGTREERSILIRDPNKLVSTAVLSSPKVTETEIEIFARMGSVSEDTLRIIGSSRAWTKRYGVIAALVKNPKTPLAMSMNLLNRLVDKDIKALSTDRNVPDALRVAARRRLTKDA